MIYGYARVSTSGQARNGNSLEDQKKILVKDGCQEIIEEQYTGTTTERPQFTALLKKLKTGDTLVVTKLDRLARTAREGSQLVHDLSNKGIRVYIDNIGIIENTAMGRAILNIFLAFAEFERDMIVERTQAGKTIAKTRAGFREGRPPIDPVRKELAVKLVLENHLSYKEAARQTNLSVSTITRAVRKYRSEKQKE